MDAEERRVVVLDLYERGFTQAAIGRVVHVSRERVRQLLDGYGVKKRDRLERLYDHVFPARAQEVEALFLRLRDDKAVAETTGIDERAVRRFVDARIPDAHVLRRHRHRRREPLYSDDDLLACLRAAAADRGPRLSRVRYAEWSRGRALDDKRLSPGPSVIALRFGTWRRALARAGLLANPSAGSRRRYDVADAVAAIVQAWRETGTPPTPKSYDRWRAGRTEFPSVATIRDLVDGWDTLKLAAWPVVHGRQLPGAARDGASTGGSPSRRERSA